VGLVVILLGCRRKLMSEIERKIRIELEPWEVAKGFCDLNNDQQAMFFNEVFRITSQWGPGGFPKQLGMVRTSTNIAPGGLSIMREIGEYGNDEREA